jgi:Zn-dependent peptidase ImmA (M78 family)
MTRIAVKPELLRWARQRARVPEDMLNRRFPKLGLWESEKAQPTLKQLERYAKTTLTPIGYLFLPEPPVEKVPIPDFRTIGSQRLQRPSPNLLETLYICQQRQSWYREYSQLRGLQSCPFVGAVSLRDSVKEVAANIRSTLGFDLEARRQYPTWEEALRHFITQADDIGVMVMCSGIVLNNTHRKLDPSEFRGFAMADNFAPLIFINGADTKAAQMFTLAHELAHLWLGQSALSDSDVYNISDHRVESWCNKVAAELLVPLDMLKKELLSGEVLDQTMARLARRFKVSTLVILRRVFDAGRLTRDQFWGACENELVRLRALPKGSGGSFYPTQSARVSKRFARSLIESTLEGHTLYRDAMQMLGISRIETFNEMGRGLNFPI